MLMQKAYSSYTIIDVTDGVNWLGELEQAPSTPKQSDAYYNVVEKKSYIYDGENWQIFSYDAVSYHIDTPESIVVPTNSEGYFSDNASYYIYSFKPVIYQNDAKIDNYIPITAAPSSYTNETFYLLIETLTAQGNATVAIKSNGDFEIAWRQPSDVTDGYSVLDEFNYILYLYQGLGGTNKKEVARKIIRFSKNKQGNTGTTGNGIETETVNNTTITAYSVTENSYTLPQSFPENVPENSSRPEGTWIWKTTRVKTIRTVTYTNSSSNTFVTYSEWTPWELDCPNAAEIQAFNALTNKGAFKGHFYGVYVWTNGTSAYFNDPLVEGSQYTGYTKYLVIPEDIDIANDILYVDINGKRTGNNGIRVYDNPTVPDHRTLKSYLDYYVNASMIQTGALLVGDSEKPAFMAGFNDGQVKIAGFEVNGDSFFGHLESKKSYLYSITYEFAQQPTSGNPVYQSTPIGLSGGTPILIRRTFNYSNNKRTSISTVCIDTIGFDSSSEIEGYVIAYSDSSSASQPTSTDNLGGFTKWSKWLPAQSNTLYEFIGVQWRASSDSGFNKLVPTTTDNSYSNKLYNLTDYKSNDGKVYFGLNMNTNHQDVSLIDDSMIQIVFYGGCAYNSPENAFFKVLADGTMKCQALEVNSIYSKGNSMLLDTVTIQLGDTQMFTGINMHTPDYDFNSSDQRGFYVGYDGINTPVLKLQGKKVNIEETTGYLKVQV